MYIDSAPESQAQIPAVRRAGVVDTAPAAGYLTSKDEWRVNMDWYLLVWKKYFQFNGRSRRKELWMFTLFNCLVFLVLGVASAALKESGIGRILCILCLIYALAVIIPCLAVGVRRLHDTGRSGWWWLIDLVPFVGPVILIVFWVMDSEPGANKYGPNPKSA